jgi:hypothetical protein
MSIPFSVILPLLPFFCIGPKLRSIRSTPAASESMSEIDFECFANTGVVRGKPWDVAAAKRWSVRRVRILVVEIGKLYMCVPAKGVLAHKTSPRFGHRR